MTLYRVLQTLKLKSGTIARGDFITARAWSPESLARLEEVGAIGLLHAPPLSELPGFDGAQQLATIGIVNADQLLEADNDMIAKELKIEPATVRAWQFEISDWLIIPARTSGS